MESPNGDLLDPPSEPNQALPKMGPQLVFFLGSKTALFLDFRRKKERSPAILLRHQNRDKISNPSYNKIGDNKEDLWEVGLDFTEYGPFRQPGDS